MQDCKMLEEILAKSNIGILGLCFLKMYLEIKKRLLPER